MNEIASISKKLPSVFSLIKESIQIYKERWAFYLGVYFSGIILSVLVAGVFALISFGGWIIFKPLINNGGIIGPLVIAIYVLVVVTGAFVLFAWPQVAMITAIHYRTEKLGVEQTYLRSWKRLWPYTLVGGLYGMYVLLGLILFIIPGIYLAIKYLFAFTIVITENVDANESMRRSKDYVKGHFWKVIWYFICSVLVYILFGIIINAIAALIPDDNLLIILKTIISFILNAMLGLIAVIYGYLIYTKLREIKLDSPNA